MEDFARPLRIISSCGGYGIVLPSESRVDRGFFLIIQLEITQNYLLWRSESITNLIFHRLTRRLLLQRQMVLFGMLVR